MAGPEFWLYLPQLRMSFDAILDRSRAAEEAGFAGVALMDHLAPPGLPQAPMYDAMTTAAAILAGTSSIRVGHLVLCGSFRHPSLLAKEIVGLDHLSSGRFELGIGYGSVPDELARFGLPVESGRERAARTREVLDVVKRLFTGEVVDHEGRFFVLRGAQQAPRPLAGSVPVVIGGSGPAYAMPLVRDHADWWNCPSYAVDRLAELQPLAEGTRVSTQHPVGLALSPETQNQVAAELQRRFGGWGGHLVGSADRIAGGLAELVARGVERFYLQFSDFGSRATLAHFGEHVIATLAPGRSGDSSGDSA